MRYEIKSKRTSEASFIVCLIAAPKFPENEDHIRDLVRKPLTSVIAAAYDEINGWGYTHLSRDEKKIIGDMLVSRNYAFNQWAYCDQFLESSDTL